MNKDQIGVFIPAGRKPWPHELHAAEVLALAGHRVEFLVERSGISNPDILLDGIEYEIKSPEGFNANTFEHTLKDALKQAPNIIITTSRIKKVRDLKVRNFLINQVRNNKHIKHLIMITKRGQIIDISALAWYNVSIEVLTGRSCA